MFLSVFPWFCKFQLWKQEKAQVSECLESIWKCRQSTERSCLYLLVSVHKKQSSRVRDCRETTVLNKLCISWKYKFQGVFVPSSSLVVLILVGWWGAESNCPAELKYVGRRQSQRHQLKSPLSFAIACVSNHVEIISRGWTSLKSVHVCVRSVCVFVCYFVRPMFPTYTVGTNCSLWCP